MKRKRSILSVLLPLVFLIILMALYFYNETFNDEQDEGEWVFKETYQCDIKSVADGDTLTALCKHNDELRQARVRLIAIDAPEYDYTNSNRTQPFGKASRESLKNLCLRTQANITIHYKDRYDRLVAEVNCRGLNANAEQVKAGMAWVYDGFANQHQHFYALQKQAQHDKTGLWHDAKPTPPWEWRKTHR